MRFNVCLAALAATAAFASPAFAQQVTPTPTPPPITDTATATARGLVLLPLTLTMDDNLDFGTIVASATAGAVTIDANSGDRSKSGGVTLVTSAPGNRAVFLGAGDVGQQVTLSITPPSNGVLLNAADDEIPAELVFDDDGATRTIGTSGVFKVGVGGTFDIAANQPNGEYEAEFSVTADYK